MGLSSTGKLIMTKTETIICTVFVNEFMSSNTIRFWPSTAAYAIAHEVTTNKGNIDPNSTIFHWPSDLLRPDAVLFLVVSEKVRRYRHAYRNTTNTKEEQRLASDEKFREKYEN